MSCRRPRQAVYSEELLDVTVAQPDILLSLASAAPSSPSAKALDRHLEHVWLLRPFLGDGMEKNHSAPPVRLDMYYDRGRPLYAAADVCAYLQTDIAALEECCAENDMLLLRGSKLYVHVVAIVELAYKVNAPHSRHLVRVLLGDARQPSAGYEIAVHAEDAAYEDKQRHSRSTRKGSRR